MSNQGPQAAAFHAAPEYATLNAWIQQAAIPFSITMPDSFAAAVARLIAALGDRVTLLGLGEPLHGGEEFLILRNRLFQCLVAAHGYRAIAVESSFPRSYLVNEALVGAAPLDEALFEAGLSHGFGQLAANRELVAWMANYNRDPAHAVKLHFYGFDGPMEMYGTDSPRQVLHFVLDYLEAQDPASGAVFRQRIDALLGEDAAWQNPAAMMDPGQSIGLTPRAQALRIETENLIAELTFRRPEFVAHGGPDRYAEAMQFAREARQLLTYHAEMARESDARVARGLGMRDALMADNLAYIAAREEARGKVLVFAHNSHLKRGPMFWQLGPYALTWYPAGAHLEVMFGPRYAVIGTALGRSADNGIGEPEAGTLEAQLTAAPGPGRFIPTYRGRGLPAAEVAALTPRSGSQINMSYFPLTPQSFTDFDWLAILDTTTYTRGGPPLPQPGA